MKRKTKHKKNSGELYRLKFSSGKSYIGITMAGSLSRFNGHRKSALKGSKCAVHRAWRKYGEPIITILKTGLTLDKLLIAEKRAIKKFRTMIPNGYNMTPGGEISPTNVPEIWARMLKIFKSPEFSSKLSKALNKPETQALLSAIRTGRKHTEETKAKMSRNITIAVRKPGVKEKRDNHPNRVKKHTEETKTKISKAITGIIRSEETCAKISKIMKSKKRSPQTQAKMTAALRTPEMRQHMAIMSGSRKHTEASKAKMSESQKKRKT